ncbi:hypothetical protein HY772_07370 [Candidatus Woesearchaeota archaeon]|nr:hypothetical protein [Candidatus Woesearchaeota archaeon]
MDLMKEKHAQRQGAPAASTVSVERQRVEKAEKEFKHYAPRESFLDKQISIRALVRNVIVVLLILAILAAVFLLGRWSALSSSKDSQNLTITSLNSNTVMQKGTAKPTMNVSENAAKASVGAPNASVPKEENKTAIAPEEASAAQMKPSVTNVTATPSTTPEKAGEGFEYKSVGVYIGEVKHLKKGDDWGTVTSIEVTVENLEKVLVYPVKVKARLYKAGEEGNWWDMEEDVPALMTQLASKASAKYTFETHISYSGLTEEKTLKVVVFDQYNQKMGDVIKTVTLS